MEDDETEVQEEVGVEVGEKTDLAGGLLEEVKSLSVDNDVDLKEGEGQGKDYEVSGEPLVDFLGVLVLVLEGEVNFFFFVFLLDL